MFGDGTGQAGRDSQPEIGCTELEARSGDQRVPTQAKLRSDAATFQVAPARAVATKTMVHMSRLEAAPRRRECGARGQKC